MKVIIVDDHQLVLDGFCRIMEAAGHEVAGRYTDSQLALERIISTPPDLVLTDLDMPGLNGADLISAVRAQIPDQKFVLLTMHLNQQVIKKMMSLKVNGYLAKTSHPEELIEAAEAVYKGRNYFAAEVTQALAFQSQELQSQNSALKTLVLSEREKEVLQLIAMGESTKLIADQLHISVGTVESHRSAIMKKLEVSNVAGMVRIAVKEGLV